MRFFNGTEDLLDMFEIGTFNIVYIGAREKVPTVETRPQKLRTPECNASESESQEGQGQKQPYSAEDYIIKILFNSTNRRALTSEIHSALF